MVVLRLALSVRPEHSARMRYIHFTRLVIGTLIASILFLGFLSVLSIWDVIPDDDVLWKSFTTSIVLIVVGSVTLTSIKYLEEREKEKSAQ